MENPPAASPPSPVWAYVAGGACALLLFWCAPLFLCQPLWADATHYDVLAQEVLRGRTLYHDVSDTNFPGAVWVHMAVRRVAGWRSEALRGFDLLVVVGIAALLVFVATRGRPHAAALRAFGAAAILMYYFAAAPMVHCQRDVWMLLCAAGAVALRQRQISAAAPASGRALSLAIAEGICWGVGVWIKPYVIIPAAACWLGGMIFALRRGAFRALTATCDAAGLLIGGLIAGGAGCWWLSATGSWAPFWEIVLHWSGEYRTSVGGWGLRLATNLSYYVYYAPWSLLALVAVPLAVRNCIDALAPPAKVSPDSGAAGRLLLSLLYLAWLVQASLIQLSHEYVLAVPLMIGLALLVAWDRVARPSPGMQGALALFVLVALAVHPLARPRALAAWPLCASAGSTPEVKDRLSTGAKRSVMGEAHWQDLAKVADFLRSQNIHDGELACWDDSSQALYTQLHISPSSRFVHVANWLVFFPSRRQEIMHDVLAGRPRFVVTDVQMAGYSAFLARDDHQRDEAVWPDGMPPRPDQFPWNQPIAFRAGRYLVFAVGDESLPASSTEASR